MALNLQGYAAHRKSLGLPGQTHVAVLYAIRDGRLHEPAVMKVAGRWQIDPMLADVQWAGNTDMTSAPVATLERQERKPRPPAGRPAQRAPKPPPPEEEPEGLKGLPKLAVSKAVRAAYDAKMAELEYKKQVGNHVSIEDVKREAASLARNVRDNILGIPDRIAPQLAACRDVRDVHRLLSEELRVALRVLADG